MKKYLKIILFLVICLSVLSPSHAFAAAEGTEIVEGWNGSQYFENGKICTGFKKIDGKIYYFDEKTGKLVKNKIVKDKKGNAFYVDESGVKCTDSSMKLAISVITKNTKDSWSKSKKLKACFDYFINKTEYERAKDEVAIEKMPEYAAYMMKNKKGNCYRSASAMAYCAKALGYKTRICVGLVSASKKVADSPHGWVEIKVDDEWKMCDISMQRPRVKDKINLYLLTREKYPFALECQDTYNMSVKNGKVKWSN